MAYNTVTVGASATQIVAANAIRHSLVVVNTSSSVTLYLGPDTSITTANAIEILPHARWTEDSGGVSVYKGPLYGITGSSADVRYWERTDYR